MFFHRLINLFGRQKLDRFHPRCPCAGDGERDGCGRQIVRNVENQVSVVFSERKVECLKMATEALQQFLNDGSSRNSASLCQALDSLRGIGSYGQVLVHRSTPKNEQL